MDNQPINTENLSENSLNLNDNIQPNNESENLKKKFPIWLGIVIILLTFILVWFIVTILIPKKPATLDTSNNNKPNSVFTNDSNPVTKPSLASTTYPEIDLTQKIDADKDGIPDWVEEKIETDPKHAECSEFLKECADVEGVNNKVDIDNLVLILDSSGSMVANIGGETRMEVAKSEVLKYVTNYVGVPLNVGLIVYGHKGSNSESDKAVSCAGIETLHELKTVDYPNLELKVNALKPTGWTPISASIYAARDLLLKKNNGVIDTESKNSIIIVTDGEETCGGDPVKAVNDIKAQGFNIKVDLIALGTTDAENTSLKAIATAGNGEFVSVTDSRSQLYDALMDNVQNKYQGTLNSVCNTTGKTDVFLCGTKIKRKLIDFRNTINQQKDPNLYLYLYQDSYSKDVDWFKNNPFLDTTIIYDSENVFNAGVHGDFNKYLEGLKKYLGDDIDKNRDVQDENEAKFDELTQ